MRPRVPSLAREIVATFFAASATDGIIDNIDCDEHAVAAFASKYDADDAVRFLCEAYDNSHGRDKGHLKETLRHGPSGSEDPLHPAYILVLFACCIVQQRLVNAGRGSQNFRRALGDHLDTHIEALDGLPDLWQGLKRALGRQDLELFLPDKGHRLVRYHRFMVFPVRHDRDRIDRLLLGLPRDRRLNDEMVARAIASSRGHGEAYNYHLRKWIGLWAVGDPRHRESTFWKALSMARARLDKRARLVVRPSDTFPFELRTYIINDGFEAPALDLEAAELVTPVADGVRRGRIDLRDLGMDRFQDCVDGSRGDTLLLRTNDDGGDSNVPDGRPVWGGQWTLVRRSMVAGSAPVTSRQVGWSGATRVGSAYLHAGPFSPRYWATAPGVPVLRSEEGQIALERSDGAGWWIGGRTLDGRLRLETTHSENCGGLELQASSRAVPHHPDRMAEFDPTRMLHEDGILERTSPPLATKRQTNALASTAVAQDHRMTWVGEALYARSARGIGYGEAIGLVRLIEDTDTPSTWDLLRTFIDGGWFETGWVRGAEARRLCPRRPRLVTTTHGLLLDGMVCEEDIRRLSACAERNGARLLTVRGSPWEPSTIIVKAAVDQEIEIAEQARLPIEDYVVRPLRRPSDGARPIQLKSGWTVRSQFGIGRASRDDGHEAPEWLVGGDPVRTHRSMTTALLHHAERSRMPAFVWRDGRLERTAIGAVLPSSWARWLRMHSGRSAGVVAGEHGWSYGYPASRRSARMLAEVTDAIRADASVPSWVALTRSRAGRRRLVHNGRRVDVRT